MYEQEVKRMNGVQVHYKHVWERNNEINHYIINTH